MFIYTLGFIFAHTNVVKPAELLIFVAFLYFLLYFTTPSPYKTEEVKVKPQRQVLFLEHVYASFRGENALWLVFWPYFVILNILLITADSLAMNSSLSVSSWDDIMLFSFSSSLVWLITIWRSSEQTNSRIWAALARLIALCTFIDYALRILIRVEYPRIFFNCEEAILNYSSCF